MRLYFIIASMLFVCTSLNAHWDPLYYPEADRATSLEQFKSSRFNPAFTGLNHDHFLKFNHQDNYSPYPLSFVYTQVKYERFADAINSGFGLQLSHYTARKYKRFEAEFNYSYQLELDKGHQLFLGASMAISKTTMSLNAYGFQVSDIYYPYLLLRYKDYFYSFDLGLGAVYKYENFTAGFAIKNLNNFDAKYNYNKKQRSYYLDLSTLLKPNDYITIEPMAFLRATDNFFQYEPAIKATYRNKFWMSLSYRSKDFFTLEDFINSGIGIRFNKRVYLAYAFAFSPKKNIFQDQLNIHEAQIVYLIK
jgi:type IX secretion system PorP/SprF family membrane protein